MSFFSIPHKYLSEYNFLSLLPPAEYVRAEKSKLCIILSENRPDCNTFPAISEKSPAVPGANPRGLFTEE